jgi:hypothetical protein
MGGRPAVLAGRLDRPDNALFGYLPVSDDYENAAKAETTQVNRYCPTTAKVSAASCGADLTWIKYYYFIFKTIRLFFARQTVTIPVTSDMV